MISQPSFDTGVVYILSCKYANWKVVYWLMRVSGKRLRFCAHLSPSLHPE